MYEGAHFSSWEKLAAAELEDEEKAACRDAGEEDRELFFSYDRQPGPEREAQFARAIDEYCEWCPIAQQCGEFAVQTEREDGIWGGMLPDELKEKVKAKRKRDRELTKASRMVEAIFRDDAHEPENQQPAAQESVA